MNMIKRIIFSFYRSLYSDILKVWYQLLFQASQCIKERWRLVISIACIKGFYFYECRREQDRDRG
jgi:hypothetical protein